MHFAAIVLIPQDVPLEETTLYEAIQRLIDPYYSELPGPRRKVYYDARAIEHLAARYWVRATNLPKIAARLRKDLGVESGVDEGGLYYITDLNPDGKYDRWTWHPIAEHGWLVKDIPRDLLPVAVVTPDGQWHNTGLDDLEREPTPDEERVALAHVHALIDPYPEYRAIPLDCHA